MVNAHINIPLDQIRQFCRKWKIVEFSLFGSVLREDFRPDSDVDVLVVFGPDATWDYWDGWVEMNDELKAMFGRDVDWVEKKTLRNPFRRESILQSHQVVYAG